MPLLTGEAQWAYFTLSETEEADFMRLRQEILDRCGLSATRAAGQFHVWVFGSLAAPAGHQTLVPAQYPVVDCGGGAGGDGQVPEGSP